MAGLLKILNIETAVTEEEEAAEGLETALGTDVKEDRDREGEEGSDGTQQAL